MDFGFRKGARLRPIARAALDQRRLVAAVSAMQTASPTARALAEVQRRRLDFPNARCALAELLVAGARRHAAEVTLGHAFSLGQRSRQTFRKPN